MVVFVAFGRVLGVIIRDRRVRHVLFSTYSASRGSREMLCGTISSEFPLPRYEVMQ